MSTVDIGFLGVTIFHVTLSGSQYLYHVVAIKILNKIMIQVENINKNTVLNVVEMNFDVVVSVSSALFVPETQGM